MKILYLCDEYPPGKNGGIGTAIQVVSRELARQGHSVYVLGLYAHSYGQADYEEDNSVKVWRFRYGLNFGNWETGYKIYRKLPLFINRHLNGRRSFAKYLKFMQDLIQKEGIDLVESPDWNTFSMFIGFVPQWPKLNVPFLLRSHGSFTYFQHELNEKVNRHMRLCDEALFQRADGFSAVSAYTANINRQLFKFNADSEIIPNSITIADFSTNQKTNSKQVFFSGALIHKKGIFSLMKAWNIVHQEMSDLTLLVYGKGKILPLQQLLSGKARDSVIFGGHVSREKVFSALSQSELAVFPSYSETFGIMVIEAMAMKCPVIYTKRSCGPEIVESGVSGELVDPDRPEEIAAAILKILGNKVLADKYRKNAYEQVTEKYDSIKVTKTHLDFYQKQIEQFNYANQLK